MHVVALALSFGAYGPLARAEEPSCVAGYYKLCRDNSDLLGNFEYQGQPGRRPGSLCLLEATRMGHKGLPPYAFFPVWDEMPKGRDFVDTGIVTLKNHGMTCTIDLDAETVAVTADTTADGPWCRDDYRACADNNEVSDHHMIHGKLLEVACQDEAARRGYGKESDFSYYRAPGRSWVDTGIARLPENADPSALMCSLNLKTGSVSITQTGPRSLRAG